MINTERILNSYGLVKGLEKWHGLYGKQYGRFPQMLTESYLPYNPVYYLVYTQEVGTIVAVCTPTYVHILLQIKGEGNPGFHWLIRRYTHMIKYYPSCKTKGNLV